MSAEPAVTVQCPACKADNSAGPQCRRCRADLELLFSLERQRQQLLGMALDDLRSGAWSRAEETARAAARLRAGGDSTRIQAAAALMQRSFDKFWGLIADLPSP